MNKLELKKLIISILEKEISGLTKKRTDKLSKIVFEYISLLNEGKIEEANTLIHNNHDQLERLI
jgi:hypothetical protein